MRLLSARPEKLRGAGKQQLHETLPFAEDHCRLLSAPLKDEAELLAHEAKQQGWKGPGAPSVLAKTKPSLGPRPCEVAQEFRRVAEANELPSWGIDFEGWSSFPTGKTPHFKLSSPLFRILSGPF